MSWSDEWSRGYWSRTPSGRWTFREPGDDPETPWFDEEWAKHVGTHTDDNHNGIAETQQLPAVPVRGASSTEAVLAAGGILRPAEVIELAAATGLDLAAAATLLQKESGGGRNVWGHDGVSTGGFYVKGSEVTQQAYLAYKAHRSRLGCQGVGPCQLTYHAYQDQADAIGGCWDWRANVTIGFRVLAASIRARGLRDGFRAYNGSGHAAERYAEDAICKYQAWRERLAGTVPEEDDLTQEEHDMLVAVYRHLNNQEPPWAGGVSDENNAPYNPFQYHLRNNVEIRSANNGIGRLLHDIDDLKAQVAEVRAKFGV
jgi:hypothetical protein